MSSIDERRVTLETLQTYNDAIDLTLVDLQSYVDYTVAYGLIAYISGAVIARRVAPLPWGIISGMMLGGASAKAVVAYYKVCRDTNGRRAWIAHRLATAAPK